ncbi:MAG: hypothetical protein AB8G05_11850 [Oligoflexales bacterium]
MVGKKQIEQYLETNPLIKSIKETDLPKLFLHVEIAKKAKISNLAILRSIGGESDDPKTGPYIACCTSGELAKFLVGMVKLKEYQNDEVTYDQVAKFLESQSNLDSNYPFNLYSLHDFRRLHITIQTFEFNDFFKVSQVHGHKDITTTQRYYQWEMIVGDELILVMTWK